MRYDFEFRQAYIEGRLTAEQKLAFEDALVEDEKLVLALKRQMHLDNWVEEHITQSEPMTSAEATAILKRPFWNSPTAKVWALVAVLVLLLVSTIVIFSGPGVEQDLFAQHYSPLKSEDGRSGPSSQSKDSLQIAFDAYDNGDYRQAEMILKIFLSTKQNESALLYLGLTYIEMDRFEEADAKLSNYLDQYTVFKNEALWYLALVKIKRNLPEEAKPLLKQLVNGSRIYGPRAGRVLDEME